MSKLAQQAVVCGAGMGGLLAARVLSEFYGTVTVVERDKLPEAADQRRGVRQGLVYGDTICSTNPIYGQGMTVAALEVTALRDCLADGNGDLSRLWASNQFNDLYMDSGDPDHAASKELLDFREAVLSAAESSPALTEKLYRSMNLVDPATDYSPLLT